MVCKFKNSLSTEQCIEHLYFYTFVKEAWISLADVSMIYLPGRRIRSLILYVLFCFPQSVFTRLKLSPFLCK